MLFFPPTIFKCCTQATVDIKAFHAVYRKIGFTGRTSQLVTLRKFSWRLLINTSVMQPMYGPLKNQITTVSNKCLIYQLLCSLAGLHACHWKIIRKCSEQNKIGLF